MKRLRLPLLSRLPLIALILVTTALSLDAQSSPLQPEATLEINTRLVIDDVIVTDGRGQPVTGLLRSAFHVQDAGKNQPIRDFMELSDAAAAPSSPLTVGTFSNAAIYRNPGSTIAMLMDPVSMTVPEQMVLRLQMLKYVRGMPSGSQAAIFRANSRGVPILVQSLTSDRALLKAAIDASVPAMLPPTDAFGNAVAQLRNIADFLLPVPGKKVLLWFGGRFPLFLDPGSCSATGPQTPTIDSVASETPDCASLVDVRRDAYRVLQQARIAVFPIDVRGVLNVNGPTPPNLNSQASDSLGSVPGPIISDAVALAGQYNDLDELARATGGRAFYSNNDIAGVMAAAVKLGTSAYTLSWRPEPYAADGKWHKVRITVDGGYNVSYRRGYFARDPDPPPTAGRLPLTAESVAPTPGTLKDAIEQPPILFSAHVLPLGEGGKRLRLKVEYAIPTTSLAFQAAGDGSQHASLRVFVLAYDVSGDVQGSTVDNIETHYSPAQMQLAARIGTPVIQVLEAGKAAKFLLLAVEDRQSKRVGTLQIPIAEAVGR